MAQAAHGSAPDIAGQDVANPFSLILSSAMLLGWHGRRAVQSGFVTAGAAVERAVAEAIMVGECTRDLGGGLGTQDVGAALGERLSRIERTSRMEQTV